MTLSISVAALAATLLLSASALAAGPLVPSDTTPQTTRSSSPPDAVPPSSASNTVPSGRNSKLAEECGTLAAQWTTVSTEHASDRKFRKASREASRGQMSCSSQKASVLRSGVRHYKSAFKLLRVTPST